MTRSVRHFDPPSQERGAALLTVLLLVAVMSVIAATALDRLQISTRLAANGAAMAQARYYAYAAEQIAAQRIQTLLSRDAAQTTLAGGWLNREIAIPVGGGLALARLNDADNCFNLNSLVIRIDGETANIYAANRVTIEQFSQLMKILQIGENESAAIAQAAADWIDSDTNSLPAGAEDDYYRALPAPYLPPNRLMADRSELRAVKGVSPQIYARIKDWVCTLPQAKPVTLNVNTLSPGQAPLLAMLFGGKLSPQAAKAYLASRPAGGYGSAVRFFGVPLLTEQNASEAVKQQVQLTSQWFELNVRIQSGGIDMESNALITAAPAAAPYTAAPSAMRVRVISRSFGEAA
jgi:general secretion pathway protein K